MVIMASSLSASGAYYRTLLPLLGFRELKENYWQKGREFIIDIKEATPGTRPYERYGAGLNHLGFSAETPEEVEGLRDTLIKAGIPTPELQHIGGGVSLFMKDPDGLRFEISYFTPEENLNA